MTKGAFSRTEKLIGREGMHKLRNSRVMVFGLGGVGGYVVEGIARAGIGSICIVDYDTVDLTNVNRQIIALNSTIGMFKTDAFRERLVDINENIRVDVFNVKVTAENIHDFFHDKCDYIVDAIDDTVAKILLIEKAKSSNTPIMSSMGAGNRVDPSKFKICDISRTHTCPLAKKIRKELAVRGINGVKALFSDEPPIKIENNSDGLASIAFVPAVAGLMIAGEVVRDLLLGDQNEQLHTNGKEERNQ